MDGLTLLDEARAAGLTVTADRGRLVIRGPRRAEPTARRLIAHKGLVLQALTADRPAIGPDDLPPDWRFVWEERAAIMEYDGGLAKEHAEAAALADTLAVMRRSGVPPVAGVVRENVDDDRAGVGGRLRDRHLRVQVPAAGDPVAAIG
jgi:hypothetical protein